MLFRSVRAAVESYVAGGRGLAAVGVVGYFIGLQDVGAIVDFGVTVQLVDVADFFLLNGTNHGAVLKLGSGAAAADAGWSCRGSGDCLPGSSGAGNAGLAGIFWRQLAGY